MSRPFDPTRWRARFPAFEREVAGRPAVFLDGPAGSQVPREVVDAVAGYLLHANANCGGAFLTSRASDAMLLRAHAAAADFVGSGDPDLTFFGPNMTSMTLALARALSPTWGSGDEILLTRLEHDANFTPWVQAATDAGATVICTELRKDDCTLDLDDLERKLSPRTRLVAVTAASNAVGSKTPVARIAEMAHAVGARIFIDAVHYAPHCRIDVDGWGVDFLACSAYKFFGPHVGILFGRREPLERLPVYKLRPSSDALPERWMTGTQNHEGIAGTLAAIDYLAEIGRHHDPAATDRGPALTAAFAAIEDHERALAKRLIDSLGQIDDVRVWGITDSARLAERTPTVSFTHRRHTASEIAARLADAGIFVWSGNYYALPLTEALGLEPEGMVRVGCLHYNTDEEVDRLVDAVRRL